VCAFFILFLNDVSIVFLVFVLIAFSAVEFKWKNSRKKVAVPLNANLITLKEKAIDLWEDILCPLDFDLITDGGVRLRDDDNSCDVFLNNKKSFLKISSFAVDFSEIKTVEVYKWAGINEIEEGPDLFDDGVFDAEGENVKRIIDHLIVHLKYTDNVYGPVSKCLNEASIREYIGPILLACALIAGNIKMSAEQNIVGKRANGPLDYAMIYKKFFILITEAKKDNLDVGIVQNLAQIVASREEYLRIIADVAGKKRTYMTMAGQIAQILSTGIISTGEKWMLLRYLTHADGTAHVSRSACFTLPFEGRYTDEVFKQQVNKLISKIIGAIQLQKEAVDDDNRNPQRQRAK